MRDVQEMGRVLDSVLKLKTPSVGIKLFKKEGDIPDTFETIHDDIMVCQLIGMSRFQQKAVAATKDSATACAMGGAASGLYAPPARMLDGTRNAGAWAEDATAAAKLMEGRLLMETGAFEAIGVCPLKDMTLEPDVVQIFGTPEQALACVYANIWDGGDRLKLETNGHGASCNEALSVPILTGEVRLALADIGERRHAGAGDELIVGIPLSQLERMVGLIEGAQNTIYSYPFKAYVAPVPAGTLRRVSTKWTERGPIA